jgi:hypothetical protein
MNYILAVDYDGTIMSGSYPDQGEPIWEVINKVKEFKQAGAEIVLWTCREAGTLQEAIDRCREVGLEFDAVNENAPSHAPYVTEMLKKNGHIFANRKIYANMYVDDKSHPSIEYFLSVDAYATVNNRKMK